MSGYPILFNNKKECMGCTACQATCPQGAIDMKADEEGYLYPNIDIEKCICCYACIKVCPMKGE